MKAAAQLGPNDKTFNFEGTEGDNGISNMSRPLALNPPSQGTSQGAIDIIFFFTEIETVSSTNVKEKQRVCKLCR